MTYTKKDVYNFITSNPVLNQHEETQHYYFTDAVLFAKPDTLEKEVYELLSGTCRGINSSITALDYKILASALDYFDEEAETFEKIVSGDYEINYRFDGFASIWNNERLGYLNINNDYDIMQIIREYGLDGNISDACACWYDRKVEECIYSIIDALK